MKRLNPGFSLHFDIAATIVQILVNRSWCDDYTIWSVCCDECPQQIFTHEVGSQPLCRCPNVIFLIFKFILDHVGYNTLLMVKCLHTFNVQILITSDFMPQWTSQMNDSDISANSAVFALNRGNSGMVINDEIKFVEHVIMSNNQQPLNLSKETVKTQVISESSDWVYSCGYRQKTGTPPRKTKPDDDLHLSCPSLKGTLAGNLEAHISFCSTPLILCPLLLWCSTSLFRTLKNEKWWNYTTMCNFVKKKKALFATHTKMPDNFKILCICDRMYTN